MAVDHSRLFCFLCRWVEPKTDGSEYKWPPICKKKRQQLKLPDPDIRPWTTREDVLMRGVAVQLSQPNFIHELLDIRLLQECKKRGLSCIDVSKHLLKFVFVDLRQDTNYQISGGSVSMLAGSRIYSYYKDRCLTGLEHMMFNGWGSDVVYQGVAEDHVSRITSEHSGQPLKRRRGKKPEQDLTLAGLAGNAQALPDLALFQVPLCYVLQRPGLFETDLDLDAILSLFNSEVATGTLVLDPGMSQKGLRALRSDKGGLESKVGSEIQNLDDSGSD